MLKKARKSVKRLARSFGARVSFSDTGTLLNSERLSSFLSLGGATLPQPFDENKLNSYCLEKKQLKCAEFRNVGHNPIRIEPPPPLGKMVGKFSPLVIRASACCLGDIIDSELRQCCKDCQQTD